MSLRSSEKMMNDLVNKIESDLVFSGKKVFIERTQSDTIELLDYKFRLDELYIDPLYYRYFQKLRQKIDVKEVCKILRKDKTTRRAVIAFWNSSCLTEDMPPCYVSVQFMIRDNILHCFVNQRSMNILYLENDVTFFSYLAKEVLKKIHNDKVRFYFTVSSLHKDVLKCT